MIWLMSEVSKSLTDSGVEAIKEGMNVGHLGWFENKDRFCTYLLCDKKPVKWSDVLIFGNLCDDSFGGDIVEDHKNFSFLMLQQFQSITDIHSNRRFQTSIHRYLTISRPIYKFSIWKLYKK